MEQTMKVAIVTGAGSGIGRAISMALLKNGYRVALAGRRIEKLEQVIRDAQVDATQALAHRCDVTDTSEVTKLFQGTIDSFGRLDLLFNNAGTNIPPVPMEEVTIEQWRSVMDTNLTGAFYCTQEAFKIMKNQEPSGGRIINNGSISAHTPRPFSAPYTASKHAITGLTKSTALDGRKYNIACGQIDIGNALTDMAQKMQTGVPQADGSRAIEPTMDVAHVAEAFLMMANLPLDANVPSLMVMATAMPYVGRG